jgi:hypothetical protein
MNRHPTGHLRTPFPTPGSQIMTMAPSAMEFDVGALETTTVAVETMCGRSFQVEVQGNTPTMSELREAIAAQLGIPVVMQRLLVDNKTCDDYDVVNVHAARLQLMQNVFGGTGGSSSPVEFKLVTEIPEMIQFRCLCHKCGIKNLPDFMKEDWCTSNFLCLHHEFGLKACAEQQCLCLLVSQDGVKTETGIPAMLNCRILCQKCGVIDFPNIMNDDCCTSACLCIHSECGMKEWQVQQWLCLRLTLSMFK